MISFEFCGKSHTVEVTWELAMQVAQHVGDPHRILASGGEVGFIQAVQIVSLATGIPQQDLGSHAMKNGARDVYRVAGEVLLGTLPDEQDAPEVDDEKKG